MRRTNNLFIGKATELLLNENQCFIIKAGITEVSVGHQFRQPRTHCGGPSSGAQGHDFGRFTKTNLFKNFQRFLVYLFEVVAVQRAEPSRQRPNGAGARFGLNAGTATAATPSAFSRWVLFCERHRAILLRYRFKLSLFSQMDKPVKQVFLTGW